MPVKHPGRFRRWSAGVVLDTLRRYQHEGVDLAPTAIRQFDQSLHIKAGLYFGTYDAALAAIGVMPHTVRKTPGHSRERIIAALRQRLDSAQSVAAEDLPSDLLRDILYVFDSLDSALAALAPPAPETSQTLWCAMEAADYLNRPRTTIAYMARQLMKRGVPGLTRGPRHKFLAEPAWWAANLRGWESGEHVLKPGPKPPPHHTRPQLRDTPDTRPYRRWNAHGWAFTREEILALILGKLRADEPVTAKSVAPEGCDPRTLWAQSRKVFKHWGYAIQEAERLFALEQASASASQNTVALR